MLLGRSLNILPEDSEIAENLPVAAGYRTLNLITTDLRQLWSRDVSPGLVVRQKWHHSSRNLQEGDVVMICDASKLKAKYKLGVLDTVNVSKDGNVRSYSIHLVKRHPLVLIVSQSSK